MASITTRPVAAGFSVSHLLSGFVGMLATWNDARVTRQSLESLSDRQLDDLGLHRGDIDAIAEGAFRR